MVSYLNNANLFSNQRPREPIGYFGILVGRPQDALLYFETTFPELLESLGESDRADLLLERSEAYIDGISESQRRNQFRDARMHIYALQGHTEKALDAMQLAIDDGFLSGWWRLDKKPHFESIRDEPRFREMVRQLREKATGGA